MNKRLLAPTLLGIAAIALGACTAERDHARDVRAPAVTIAGEAINCVQTNRIRSTTTHDDYTIDFEMVGGEIYRNTLPGRCGGLGFEQRFSYSTPTGRLCGGDTITVLYSDGRSGATCGLGQFVPVRYDTRDGGS